MTDRLLVDIETAPIENAAEFLDDDEIEAPANYKDPAKIAAYIANAQMKQLDRCGLDPDLCRIVALGCMFEGEDEPMVLTCRAPGDEAQALTRFWSLAQPIQGAHTLLTFNGMRFDLPVLIRRSMYLGVKHQPVNLDRYRSPHGDLLQILTYQGALKPRSLRFYAKRLQIPIEDAIDASDIARLVADSSPEAWSQIVAHNRSDLLLLRAVCVRMGLLQLPQVA